MARAATSANPVRVAIYSRASTDHQGSPRGALADLRRVVRARGWRVDLAVAEVGSGLRGDRAGWERVMRAAAQGLVSHVLVTRLDRAGRSLLNLLDTLHRLVDDYRVTFEATEQGITLRPGGDPASRLTLAVLGAAAEFEHALIVARVREGQARAKASGKHIGRPRTVEVDVVRVRRLRARGQSWSRVSAALAASVAACRRAVARLSEPTARSGRRGSAGIRTLP